MDDIDIEEHDVLDNPLLKNIFPDIRSIKTEVISYEDVEGGGEDEEENMSLNYEDDFQHEAPEAGTSDYLLPVGDKYRSPSASSDNTPELDIENDEEFHSEPELHNCNECDLSFPTEIDLDNHKTSSHSYVVTVRKNKAYKSTTKGSIVNRNIKVESEPEEDKTVLCNHCNEVFPDEITLIKHSYELLPVCFKCDLCDMMFDNEIKFKNHKATHSINDVYVCCPICSCHFRNKVKLSNHMRIFHDYNGEIQSRTTVDFDCDACGHSLPDCKRYNHHIQHKHPELYNKVVGSDEYQCEPCNLTFPSAYSEKVHLATKHAGDGGSQEPIPSTSYEPNYTVMPVSTLFKCNNCHINFLSSTRAVEHFKSCENSIGDYKCKVCRRFLHKPDELAHLKQHDLVEKLKGIKIRDVDIENKIVCICRKCQICFDEKGFQKCHTDECLPAKSVKCSLCRLIIHEDYMVRHSKAHATGFRTTDFIVVEYMCIDINKSKEFAKPQLTVKMDRTAKPKHLFYCPTCKCYLKINRTVNGHSAGKCNRTPSKYLCKLCGLCFTIKGMKTHKREHKLFPNLKLHEFKFISTQTGCDIEPRFPDFKKCEACSVHFFSEQARRRHSCFTEEHKTCQYCHENFSDLAFKLHVPFHKYGKQDKPVKAKIPDILKTYESLQTMWNIIYLCETCDTVLDTYDSVIEHSQNHFCNMESYNITINKCENCDLKFVGNSFDRHKELHLGNSLTKDSFIILNYDYQKLLSDEWLNMFSSLAKEQVNQILSKSIYNVTRKIRMEIAIDGPLHSTLYKCGVCNNIIDTDSVEEHAQRNNCANSNVKYHCTICRLSFATRNSKSEHDYLHETKMLDNKSYRVIVFNSEKDLYVNDVLRSKLRPEGLSFKRCQQCGKLIQKEKFQKHSMFHMEQKLKMKTYKNQPKFVTKTGKRMIHKFYTCKKCRISVLFKQTVSVHECNNIVKLMKCSKCGLMIRASTMQKHIQYHKRYPKMTAADIKIVYFQNKCLETSAEKNDLLTFYKCVKCCTTVYREYTIRRHVCNPATNKKYCELCGLNLHASNFMHHEKLHEKVVFDKTDITVVHFKNGNILGDFKQPLLNKNPRQNFTKKAARLLNGTLNYELSDRDFYRSLSARLYKCQTCKLLFITGSALAQHQRICSEHNTGVECNNCKLIYHASAIKYHTNLQRCNLKPMINFVTLTVNETYNDKTVIYLCRQCDVYNISLRGYMYHIDANHKIGKTTVKCDICEITFSSTSYRKHLKLHHYRARTTFKDLTVATVDLMSLEDALKDLPDKNQISLIDIEHAEDAVINERPAKRKLEDEEYVGDMKQTKNEVVVRSKKISTPKVQSNNSTLYTCEICNLNFLHPKTLKRHMDINRHDEARYSCAQCRLMFTKISLSRHMNTHVKDKTCFGPGYRNESRTRRSLGDGEEPTHSTRSSTAEIKPETSTRNQEPNRVNGRVETNVENSEIKLYKCAQCDVYYLREDICVEHIANHAGLDPTEYIACKMCDLQFLCEYLGSHMKTHRDKSFNMDKLIVVEYQLNDDDVKTDTYSAADRLKSKLVSTTTYFDTEDEKNIDSTSELNDSHFNQSADSISDQSENRNRANSLMVVDN